MTKIDYDIAENMLIKQAQSQMLTEDEKEKWNLYQDEGDNLWKLRSRLENNSELKDKANIPYIYRIITEILDTERNSCSKTNHKLMPQLLTSAEKLNRSNCQRCQLVFKTIMEENANFLATKSMVWKNTTPRAPWDGGVYERLIGLTKRALRRAIGRKLLKEGELIT
ncbi:unnamed protein product [Brugia pahangi]|uniref:Uncharacterized protein n=1 Tax=Brugia pahangi TaxID=6280 RepID=A0A0N4SYM9_BRUPA|nr:unnamed protein product [Brugia pahangi]